MAKSRGFVMAAVMVVAVVVAVVSVAPRGAEAKTTIEPCSGSDSCPALLGYTLYADMKVSEVAALFAVDPAALLAANALDFGAPGAAHRILPMGLFVRVPTRCSCADGVRKSVSVRYAARPADTLATVSDVVFAGLASSDQIRNENGLTSADPDAPLDAGQKLAIPLPLRLLQLIRQQPPRGVPLLRRAGRGHRARHRCKLRDHRHGCHECQCHGESRRRARRHSRHPIAR